MLDPSSIVELRLYVVGGAPNSRRAITNLANICRRHLPGRHRIEVVDVFEHPRRALDDGVFLTPQLVVASALPPLVVIGDLAEASAVLHAIGVEEEAL